MCARACVLCCASETRLVAQRQQSFSYSLPKRFFLRDFRCCSQKFVSSVRIWSMDRGRNELHTTPAFHSQPVIVHFLPAVISVATYALSCTSIHRAVLATSTSIPTTCSRHRPPPFCLRPASKNYVAAGLTLLVSFCIARSQ